MRHLDFYQAYGEIVRFHISVLCVVDTQDRAAPLETR